MKQSPVRDVSRARRRSAARELRLTPLMLSLVCLGVTPALAQTLPTGLNSIGNCTGGPCVSLEQAGVPGSVPMIIRQNSNAARAIAQWQTFSIGANDTVTVAQPSAASVLLNRVMGNELSTIAGKLNANGHVYLVNPNGVLFSSTSSVNVGGLVASTLNIENDNFMAGKQLVFTRVDGNTATVVNQSNNINAGSLVALMGAQAINEGSINVARGTAALVSARKVTVDFEGDGLTRFTIPADSKATAALVQNSGNITADGGRIALLAASEAKAQVVNQTGVLQARTMEQRNGEIILAAGLTVDEANNNTSVYRPNALNVSGTIDATGGQVRILSGQDITVTNLPAFFSNSQTSTAAVDAGSIVNADALSRTLGHASGVTLESAALRETTPAEFFIEQGSVERYSAGNGVRFDTNAQVVKTEGGNTTLTVNSARNIVMSSNSALASSSGALNVDFNADSGIRRLPDTLAIDPNPDEAQGGAILLNTASISTNGGNIRFYGQSDPVNGRAVGSTTGTPPEGSASWLVNGIAAGNSTLNTCVGTEACAGAGSISLRGQGDSGNSNGGLVDSGAGVYLVGTRVFAGGDITIDGRGALGASGVLIASSPRSAFELAAVALPTPGFGQGAVASMSGNISIVGRTRGWNAATDPVVVPNSPDASLSEGDIGGGSGVRVARTPIVAVNGNVRIDGQGADLTALGNDAVFQRLALNSSNSATLGASHGVALLMSDIGAGVGRSVDITGRSGGNGFTVSDGTGGAPPVQFDTANAYGVQLNSSAGSGAVRAEGGRITVDGQGTNVQLSYTDDNTEGEALTLLDASSASGKGGQVSVSGRDVLITNGYTAEPDVALIDASGATGGGSIALRSSGSMAIDGAVTLRADATGSSGNGGSITAVAQIDLRSHGTYSARGGQLGGNGGFIETSGKNISLTGIRVDAAAPAGTAGTWLIDPFNVTIVDGAATGTFTNPFEPLADSTIQDGDIDAALNGGTSVTIGTGAPDPTSFAGNITFATGAGVNATTGSTPVTFRLEAARSISGFGTNIQSTAAPLNVEFVAGLSGATGSINYNGQILTNGGSVTMNALGNSGSCAICMNGTLIDTRGATGDGSVSLTVPAPGTAASPGSFTSAAINLSSTDISTGSGDVNISGFSQNGTGVRLDGTLFIGEGRLGVISTTTGDINVTGVGAFSSNSTDLPGHGVVIDNARLASENGNIAVRGLRQAGATPGTGVSLQNGAQIITTGTGDIEVTGEALGGGTGVMLTAAFTNPQGVPFPASKIDGNRNVVLRASNDGSSDAIVLNGTVRAGQVLNLRPGGVNASTGAGADRPADAISLLGGSGATGYAISADELSRLTAATVVVGGSTHAANIDVLAPMASSVPLTLQNNAGGNINLTAPISAPTLGLISGGNITQAAGASITAGTLLAQSFGGNVILADPGNNVSASTLGGGAAQRFEFVNSGPLRVGAVSVTAFDSAGNLPQVQAASSMVADTLLIRTLSGELILDTSVGTANGADLVAATTFQNPGGGSLGGAPWRVWADTWVGEARGGLVGSGQLPNLYHCAYLGLCTVTVSPGDNHFIYAQQPAVTVNIGSFARPVGQPNPNFTFTLSGLILGDTGAGITGTTGTEAGLQSPTGRYPVFGTFTSAEGYLVNVVPGELVVTSVLPQPARFVDVLRDEPTTYLYDRNIGQAPICLATGPLEGDRAQQGNDILAREWSRVRTRPNLTSCVDTERSNGCADF